MKHILITLAVTILLISACQDQKKPEMKDNPFFTEWETPFSVPPFDLIAEDHFLPAITEAINIHNEEIEQIAQNTNPPTFENTIVAFDRSGKKLRRANRVFSNLNSANTNDHLQKIAKEIAPLLSSHSDNIMLNEDLFKRVKAVYDKKTELEPESEDLTLLNKIYERFERGGANLSESQKERFKEINKELSVLSLQFRENQLAETNNFKLLIDNKDDLAGLPESVIAAAAETAENDGIEGKWIFTLHKPSLIPFITYSHKRDLREYLFNGYINRGSNNNEHDNKTIVNKMVNLRLERAKILGYENHASYVLDINMAKTPEKAFELINNLMSSALPVAKKEAAELQKMIERDGGDFRLKPWDWWYYTEKLKKEKYDFDDEVLRPYFQLENVKQGVFDVSNRLYGLKFVQRTDLPLYHPEAETYEIKESDGSTLGILYMDFFPRESKRAGAWMTSFRKQYKENGENILPVIQVVCNFSKPTVNKPALLSLDEALTLFHEFGHALHGLLSDCTYETLSGTSVPRDFVELPSQIMENWAANPEVLAMYAHHYETGEPIPEDLIRKMNGAGHFNQGFTTVEFISAAILDMDWHTITENQDFDVMEFENNSLENMKMIPEIVVRYRSPYFAHIFAGGYSSGYYSYAWAEVLDADAFEAFKENGIFDRETADAFRENILSKGGTEDPMKLYVQYRGKEPSVDAMLERKGLANEND